MEEYSKCANCGEEFHEDELDKNGECSVCREKELATLDEIAQENGFPSWGASYEY